MRPPSTLPSSIASSLRRSSSNHLLSCRKRPFAGITSHSVSSSSSSASSSSSSSTRSSTASVNDEEVRKFEAYGAGWWDEKGRSGAGPLHAFNPIRVKYIADRCRPGARNLEGIRILDVGCGGGLLSEALARLGAQVTGIDPALANIDVAIQHASIDPLTQNIRYEHATAEEFLAAGDRFDAVVASEVIEHVESPADFMVSLAGLVSSPSPSNAEVGKTEGHVILSTINRTVKSYLVAILGAEYITRLVPQGTHEWSKFIQPQELAYFCRAAGLQVKDVSGIMYNPIKGHWKLKPSDLDVNYLLHASIPLKKE